MTSDMGLTPDKAGKPQSKALKTLERKPQDKPDETCPFKDRMGKVDIFNVGGHAIGRCVFEPGWRWSQHVKPLAGTPSCQVTHTGLVLEGRLTVEMDDGDRVEYGPGDAFFMPPGLDAWVVGDERCVLFDFTGMEHYAQRA